MTVNHNHRIGSALNVLKKLNYENASVVGADHHTRKVRGHIESLICDLFVAVEKAVLVSCEIGFCDILIEIENAVWVFARI